MSERSPSGWTVEAPAKVNLYLHVTDRRADGYHLLDSLVVFAGVADTLEVHPADHLTLAVDGPFADQVPSDADNLVVRAADALADAAGVPPFARIRLTKRLPVAAGIGGGSADAAAALRALSLLWDVEPPDETLFAVGLSLGADVPVCLAGRPAFVGGVGEEAAAAPALPPCGLVLANPGAVLATPAVFARRAGPFSTGARFDEAPADVQALASLLSERRNDLTVAAIALEPAIGAVLEALATLPGALLARMSGSGATGFALFEGGKAAERAAALLKSQHPDWWIAAAPIRTERPAPSRLPHPAAS